MLPTICFPFVGDLVGGSHISAVSLIERIDRRRFRPLVLLQHETGALADLFAEAGIAITPAPPGVDLLHDTPVGIGAAIRLAVAAPRLAAFLRARSASIVHCNDGRTLATWAFATRLAGARLLWHHRGSPRALGLRWLAPLVADRVAAVSGFAAPRPGLWSAAARTRVIHSPFDTTTVHDRRAAHAAVAALAGDATPETRYIGFSGAFIDRKRPLLFIEAIAAARARAPQFDIRGILFGDTPGAMLDAARRRAADLGIARSIVFAGYRTPGAFWLAGCDLLLVPAIDEPFGRTLIEAMLAGTPVVATRSGGNIEAIDHGRTGMLAPPDDAAGLAFECIALLADPDRIATIAATAREEARGRFGEAAHVAAITELYGDLLAMPARRGAASSPRVGRARIADPVR